MLLSEADLDQHEAERLPAPSIVLRSPLWSDADEEPHAGRLRALPRTYGRWSLIGVGLFAVVLLLVGLGSFAKLLATLLARVG